MIKLCLSYEHGMLPGNLHYQEPNPNCASLHDGTLKVQDQPFPSPDTHLHVLQRKVHCLSDQNAAHTIQYVCLAPLAGL